MSEARDYKYVGQRTIRPDGFDKVTGRANYAADFSLPGMLWGKILRSSYAHARIKGIDTSKAEALPGVLSVATHADFHKAEGSLEAGESTMDVRDLSRNILADNKVLYHGHAVAAVAAIAAVWTAARNVFLPTEGTAAAAPRTRFNEHCYFVN